MANLSVLSIWFHFWYAKCFLFLLENVGVIVKAPSFRIKFWKSNQNSSLFLKHFGLNRVEAFRLKWNFQMQIKLPMKSLVFVATIL